MAAGKHDDGNALSCLLVRSCSWIFFASRVAASYTSRLRSDIFNRVLDYSQTEIKKFSIPSLLTRTTNDITQVQMLITMGLQVVTRGPIMAIWAIGKILGHSEY